MIREGFNKKEERKKPLSARIEFGEGGHEKEYTLDLDGCDLDHYIPWEIESEIKKELGEDWYVLNRGIRIEIVNRKAYGSRDDEKIRDILKKVLTPRGYLLKE